MATTQVRDLAEMLKSDGDLRTRFREDARGTVDAIGIDLGPDELEALDAVDWSAMGDPELLVRIGGASIRGTNAAS